MTHKYDDHGAPIFRRPFEEGTDESKFEYCASCSEPVLHGGPCEMCGLDPVTGEPIECIKYPSEDE